MGAETSLSGYVRSMTDAILPDSMRSRRTIRSSEFSDAMNVPSFWLTSGGQQVCPELAVGAAEAPPVGLASDDDEPSGSGEGSTEM